MHVSGAVETGPEAATDPATARPGAPGGAPPHGSAFGALLLLFLQPTAIVPPPPAGVGGDQRGSGDAVAAPPTQSVAPVPGMTTSVSGDALAAADVAGAGAMSLDLMATPTATVDPRRAIAASTRDARAVSPALEPTAAPATMRSAPVRDAASESSPVTPSAPTTPGSEESASPDLLRMVPIASNAEDAGRVAPSAGHELAPPSGAAVVGTENDAARAITSATVPVAPPVDAAPQRTGRVVARAAAVRPPGNRDADAPVDATAGHPLLPPLGEHADLSADRDDDATGAGASPARHQHGNGPAGPDAVSMARATPAPTRIDTPQAVSAPAPTDPSRPLAAPPLAEQVVHTARLGLRDGVTEMEVQLTPPSLGVVRVTAAAAHDGLGLTISAERPETRALLMHAIPEMQAALASQGISTSTIAVASAFDPPGERRAPLRRDSDRPSSRPARDVIAERPRTSRSSAVGALDLTV